MPQQSTRETQSERRQRSERPFLVSLAILLIAALWVASACNTAPFTAAPVRLATDHAAAPTTPHTPPTLDSLNVTYLATLETGSDTPSPAFAVDGRSLVYHVEERDDHKGYPQRSELHLLDIEAMTDRVVRTAQPVPVTPAYDNYDAYGNVITTYDVRQDLTYHPAILADGDMLGAGFTIPSSYETERHVKRISAYDGRTVIDFAIGGAPRMSPTGDRIAVQTTSAIAITKPNGEIQEEVPGYFGVFSPDGAALIGHFRPWKAGDYWASSPTWPEDLEVPYTGEGGLFLWKDGVLKPLTNEGGNPCWRPDGDGFAYESPDPSSTNASTLLIERTFGEEEPRIIGKGSHPSYHPSGGVLVYENRHDIMLADGETTRRLHITGREPVFSPDGALLVVQVPQTKRRAHGARDLMLYRVTW